MSPSSADPDAVALIRRLVLDRNKAWISKQARSDMLAHNLTLDDVCDAIIGWIDEGELVKPKVLHSFADRVGQRAWEMKPRIDGVLFYLKVTIDEEGMPGEALGILSCHPDH